MDRTLSEFWLFLGRFHPMVVHLPIGFFLLGIIFDLLSRFPKFKEVEATLKYIYLLAAISIVVSIVPGILITAEGGYNDETLSLHWLCGILTCAAAWGLWHIHRRDIRIKGYYYTLLLILSLVFLLVTGHMGGKLTHGENYFREHVPDKIDTTR
jgi:uncharacterized membrane protein